ncbi:MAG TPA: metallophosphoesterase, partial [Planctomycetota bacterium]|nr:metallophosphoesterase [Planctomycetota bacterium]
RDSLRPLTEALAGLHAPRGVYAVLGNHDWWFDGPGVEDALEAAGVVVLDDRAVQLEHAGAPFLVAGISDETTQRPHPGRWLSALPAGLPVLAITHNPDVFPRVPARVALTLAGHTHGGQVRLPWLGRAVVPSRYGQLYAAGHVVDGGRDLFVTTGVGTSILPLRLGVPPEIAIVTLD